LATAPADVVGDFLAAFSAADFERMRALLGEDMVAWVTGPDGAMDRVEGRERYLSRIEAMDLPAVEFRVELTQPPVAVADGLLLAMVEVRAERPGRSLHNFAAHLMRVDAGVITEWWMADAKPAESDSFWA